MHIIIICCSEIHIPQLSYDTFVLALSCIAQLPIKVTLEVLLF